jgi:uridine kinase
MIAMPRTSVSPLMVGIAGGSGAGKTVLANRLHEAYADLGVSVLDQDAYYRDLSHLGDDERTAQNFDSPNAIDHDLVLRDLTQLRHGVAVTKPRYSFVNHTRTADAGETIAPARLVVFEGLFALWDERLHPLLDLKVFLQTDADVRFIRRLERDVRERGRTAESVIAQYLTSVRPMHRAHIEPTQRHADMVLCGEKLDEELPRMVRRIDVLLDARTSQRFSHV